MDLNNRTMTIWCELGLRPSIIFVDRFPVLVMLVSSNQWSLSLSYIKVAKQKHRNLADPLFSWLFIFQAFFYMPFLDNKPHFLKTHREQEEGGSA